MSRDRSHPTLIVEWSRECVTVYDGLAKTLHTAKTLESLPKTWGSGREAVLALSRRIAYVKAIRVPDASREDVRHALALTLGQHFPIAGGEMAFDFRLTDDRNADGRLAIVCGVRSEDLREALAQLTAAGIKPAVALPSAVGSQILTKSLNLPTAAVMHQNAEGLAVDVVENGELRYSRMVAEAAAAPTLEMEANKTLAASGVSCAPLVAAGGVPVHEAEYHTRTAPLEYLATDESGQLGIAIELPSAVAERVRRKHASAVRFAVLLWAAAILLAALVFWDRADAAAKVGHVESLHQSELTKLKNLKTAAQSQSKEAKSLHDALARAFQPAQRPSDVIAVITNAVPKGVWLTGITLERGKPMLVRGTGTSSAAVAAFVAKLTAEPRFRDVRLVFANNAKVDETVVVLFSISGFPVGNLPLMETEKGSAKK